MRSRPLLGRRLAVLAFALAIVAAPAIARAHDGAPRLVIDWGKLFARAEWSMLTRTPGIVDRVTPLRSRVVTEESSSWLGRSAHLTILARAWQGAQRLAGSHLCVTDALRVSRSSRMVVTRIGLTDGRIIPFAQLGLGQWRVDPELHPYLPRETEMAGQLGVGFELFLAPGAALALETDYTVLYREAHEQHAESPHVWGSFAVARMEL